MHPGGLCARVETHGQTAGEGAPPGVAAAEGIGRTPPGQDTAHGPQGNIAKLC